MKKNDNSVFYKNLDFLIKTKAVKMAELEEYCSVSPGYISRLKASNGYPNVDVLISLSSFFEVTIDSLIEYDFEHTSEDDVLVFKFVEELLKKTSEMSINWDKIGGKRYLDIDDSNKLSDIYSESQYEEHYSSQFTDDPCSVDSNMYVLRRQFQDFYLIKLKREKGDAFFTDYELYSYRSSKLRKICNASNENNDILYKQLSSLYLAIVAASKRINISKEAKDSINSFLDGSDDEFPF